MDRKTTLGRSLDSVPMDVINIIDRYAVCLGDELFGEYQRVTEEQERQRYKKALEVLITHLKRIASEGKCVLYTSSGEDDWKHLKYFVHKPLILLDYGIHCRRYKNPRYANRYTYCFTFVPPTHENFPLVNEVRLGGLVHKLSENWP